MKFLEVIHHFDKPWNLVTFAAWNKYPNENSPQVINVDILDRHVDPKTGVLHTERLFTCRQNLPSILEWFVGKDAVCYIREVSEVDPKTKRMTLRSKNVTYANLLTVEETCAYTELEAETSTTRFTQQAVFSACGISLSSMQRKIEETCVANFAKNAERGRQGLDQVIDSIVSGSRDLGHNLSALMETAALTSSS